MYQVPGGGGITNPPIFSQRRYEDINWKRTAHPSYDGIEVVFTHCIGHEEQDVDEDGDER